MSAQQAPGLRSERHGPHGPDRRARSRGSRGTKSFDTGGSPVRPCVHAPSRLGCLGAWTGGGQRFRRKGWQGKGWPESATAQARPASLPVCHESTLTIIPPLYRGTLEEVERHSGVLAELYCAIEGVRLVCFRETLVEWHAIAGQLPEVHRSFHCLQDIAVHRRLAESQAGAVPWLEPAGQE